MRQAGGGGDDDSYAAMTINAPSESLEKWSALG
jgi:hypothetical protein